MPQTDVIIIGGGPAGLAAGLAARRKGLDVTVVDCARPPIDKACGEGLMPDGMAALSALGVGLDDGDAREFRGIRFHDDAGGRVDGSFPNGCGLGIRRTALHERMIESAAAAGVRLLWGTRVTDFTPAGAVANGRLIRARWIVGADGTTSQVRRWAGLDRCRRDTRRFGFRRHYRIAPWTDCMEIYWGTGAQIYVTPVGAREVCVALISRAPHLRLEEALDRFPAIAGRLRAAEAITSERGAVSATRKLRAVCRGRVALIGDASGSVDAITGEGLCLAFRQAFALAEAMAAGDLARYQTEHERLSRRPRFMADFMLLLDRGTWLRRRAIAALAANPRIFEKMLAMHVGCLPVPQFAASGIALGWRMLTV
jgi:flavin-dependent dehydrogenase